MSKVATPAPVQAPTQHIVSWSHSRAVDFEKCKFSAYLKYVQKVPEPVRPLPPGKTEHANDRGSRVHDMLEQFTSGNSDVFPSEARHFRTEMDAMSKLFAKGMVSLEEEWAFDQDWNPTDWKTGWLRMKLDALVFLNEYEAVAIDFKTGRKFGNELKHMEQLQLYQLACFLRYPKLEEVDVELWYLDHDELTRSHFRREQGLRFRQSWDRRGKAITTAAAFPPNANKFSCRWCPFGDPANGFPNGTGHCQAGRLG